VYTITTRNQDGERIEWYAYPEGQVLAPREILEADEYDELSDAQRAAAYRAVRALQQEIIG
jgi:hypothetical protein